MISRFPPSKRKFCFYVQLICWNLCDGGVVISYVMSRVMLQTYINYKAKRAPDLKVDDKWLLTIHSLAINNFLYYLSIPYFTIHTEIHIKCLVPGMPSPGKGPGKGGGVSPLLTKIQLGPDTYTIGWSCLLTSTSLISLIGKTRRFRWIESK